MRLKGHKLTITWSGEYGVESSSTGKCPCGWTESGSSQAVVRFEYHMHLIRERAELEASKTGESFWSLYDRFKDEYLIRR